MALDRNAIEHPRPGRTDTFRRLTRFEYGNAIRDLLSLDIDVVSMLPADELSHGFDNITVRELSPTRINRYVSAAQYVSRLATGQPSTAATGLTVRVRPDTTQEWHMDGLPLGTRGGVLVPHYFPQSGEYEIRVRLTRDRNEHVEGLRQPHELDMMLDSESVGRFEVRPPKKDGAKSNEYEQAGHAHVDRHLKVRVNVAAGPHEVGVAFLQKPHALLTTKRQPLNVHYNMYRHPRLGPAVYEVTITGPLQPADNGDAASPQRISSRPPIATGDDERAARETLARLMRRACRRPIEDNDLVQPLDLYRQGRASGSFKDGMELALSGVLLHPEFLLRIERDPAGLASGTAYEISDIELASRLSFFLWGSLPDDELLDLAEHNRLGDNRVLERQTRRMLADTRSRALVDSFAAQWLSLRNLDATTPDARMFPDFDDNLRQALRRETELLFETVIRDDLSIMELLAANFTFLNERLAKHYGIPHIYGSRFRKVALPDDSHRGGLLRHGSILMVTSYATRTSPVLRGNWVLENILGTPTPPPPPDVPTLEQNVIAANLPVRERLNQHRADPACASCHDRIDPIGFALDHFDAVGRWRTNDSGQPIDSAGGLPDGTVCQGVSGLEQLLLQRPDVFASTLTEKLLTYALGRGCESHDAPAVRAIVRDAAQADYRFSALILGIVRSTPFRMRTTE